MDVDSGQFVEEPAYDSPAAVGDEVLVAGTLSTVNDVGGTTLLRHEGTTCRVTRSWWDYETGWRFAGRVEDPEAVAANRAQSTTGFDAEHYRRTYPNAPHLAESAEKAARAFDPSTVYFSEHDLAPSPAPAPR